MFTTLYQSSLSMVYQEALRSGAIEAIISLEPGAYDSTGWQFLSTANRVSYLYSSQKGPNITTIDIG